MFDARVTITWWYNNTNISCKCSSSAGKTDTLVLHDVMSELEKDNWLWRSMKLTSRHVGHTYGTIEYQRGDHQFLTLQVFPA